MSFTLLVKVKVTVKETGVSRETGCDNNSGKVMDGTLLFAKKN